MDAKLAKSLTDLIDETLQELEELRKSRFSAAEIELEGPGEGIAGKPSNGELNAKKSEDEEEEKKKKKMSKEEDCGEEMDKAEEEDDEEEEEDKDEESDEEMDKVEEKKHPYKKETAEAAKKILEMHKGEMKKSLEETQSLMKSYVDERVKPLEDKLSTILELVNKIAEQPTSPKGVTARTAPLLKSTDEGYSETLSKSEVASKLFELKKSGSHIDSLDIAKVEMGQDLATIIKKYNLK